MKIINHRDGNYTHADPTSSSVMYGTIEVTKKEWEKILSYLVHARGSMKDTYYRDGLRHLFSYTLPAWQKRKEENRYPESNNRICIGVSNTELIFKRFKLPRYKRQNYVIVIK